MADQPDPTDAQIAAARACGEITLRGPRAIAARYLSARDRIEIDMAAGWSIQVPRGFSPRLAAASAEDCARIELTDFGLGLHWPALDEDWYVPAVVEALTASQAA